MRKYLFALISLLPLAARAQFGVRAGIHSTQWLSSTSSRSDSHVSTRQQLGYQVGFTYQLPLVGHLSLVPELSYSYRSFELHTHSYSYGGYSSSTQFKLSYLTLPVLERVTFGPVYAEVGPQLSLLVGGREKGREYAYTSSYSSYIMEAEVDRPAAKQYRRLDVGVCAGIGVQLPMGLGLNLRFVQGINSLTQDYEASQGYDGEIRSRSVQASLTYRLPKAS